MAQSQVESPINILSATGKSSATTVGTTSITGDWFRIHPSMGRPSWQVIQQSSSVGATASSTTYIEVTNSTSIAVATKAQTLALTGTTDLVSDGAVLASSMSGAWAYIRANLNSLSTSTAGTTGNGPVVNVLMNFGTIASF